MPYLSRSFWGRWWDDRSVRKEGCNEGKTGIPPSGSTENAAFERIIAEEANKQNDALAIGWQGDPVNVLWARAGTEFDAAGQTLRYAADDFAHASEDYQTKHGKRAPDNLSYPLAGYVAVMFLMFLCELPLNAMVFRIFGESELFTYLFTCGLALITLTGGHLLGKTLKQGIDKTEQKILAALAVIVPLVMMISVAIFRSAYLDAVSEAGESSQSNFGEQSETGGIDYTILFFFAVNAFFYLVAVKFSYEVHDPELNQLYKAQVNLSLARDRIAKATKRLGQAADARRRRFGQYHGSVHWNIKRACQLVQIYRNWNHRARGQQIAWPKDPQMLIPKMFQKSPLEWGEEATGGSQPVVVEPKPKQPVSVDAVAVSAQEVMQP